MTRRDSLVTIKVPTAISGISRAQNKRFYRSTRLTPAINLIDTGHWIDGYYNRERRHSTIGYLSPIDYEQQFINTRTLSPVEP